MLLRKTANVHSPLETSENYFCDIDDVCNEVRRRLVDFVSLCTHLRAESHGGDAAVTRLGEDRPS